MKGRELKFRAWDNKAKEWLMGYELPNLGGFSLFGECMLMEEWSKILSRFMMSPNKDREFSDLIVEQFSGIMSHRDQEIYEGDVISWNVKTDEVKDKRLSAVVEFVDGCFMAAGRPLMMLFNFNVISDITVDTNIHESPELV